MNDGAGSASTVAHLNDLFYKFRSFLPPLS